MTTLEGARVQHCIDAEAEAMRALFSAQDTAADVAYRADLLHAGAVSGAQEGRNEEHRKALTLGILDLSPQYQQARHDLELATAEVRECEIALKVAQHQLALAMALLRAAGRDLPC